MRSTGARLSLIELIVYGIAQPQGSKAARVVKGRAILTEGFGDGPRRRKAWREAVADQARAFQAVNRIPLLDGPLSLTVWFYLPRPASLPKRVKYPIRKPDGSKLLRSVEDSLTGILVADDARFVDLFARKRFAEDGPPRVVIRIKEVA
jgi:Holliday junction resolvase RusA-like endonuclease